MGSRTAQAHQDGWQTDHRVAGETPRSGGSATSARCRRRGHRRVLSRGSSSRRVRASAGSFQVRQTGWSNTSSTAGTPASGVAFRRAAVVGRLPCTSTITIFSTGSLLGFHAQVLEHATSNLPAVPHRTVQGTVESPRCSCHCVCDGLIFGSWGLNSGIVYNDRQDDSGWRAVDVPPAEMEV